MYFANSARLAYLLLRNVFVLRTSRRKDTERNNKAPQGTRTENNDSKQLKIS